MHVLYLCTAIVEGRGVARGEIGMAYIDLKRAVLLLSQVCSTFLWHKSYSSYAIVSGQSNVCQSSYQVDDDTTN